MGRAFESGGATGDAERTEDFAIAVGRLERQVEQDGALPLPNGKSYAMPWPYAVIPRSIGRKTMNVG